MLSIIVEIAPAKILWSNIGNKNSKTVSTPQYYLVDNIEIMVCVETHMHSNHANLKTIH